MLKIVEIVNESNHKPNKLWLDQGREFYNNLMQQWLGSNDILMYSTHNEGNAVVAERFIKTSKGKICKKMTANDRKYYLIYLNKSADERNNICYRSIGKEPVVADYSFLTRIFLAKVTPKNG